MDEYIATLLQFGLFTLNQLECIKLFILIPREFLIITAFAQILTQRAELAHGIAEHLVTA